MPHYVYLRVTNRAGLKVTIISSPVLFDMSQPIPGRVSDGDNFLDDLVWTGNQNSIKGDI